MKILLDTNFLIDLFRFKIDVVEIFELVPDGQIFVTQQVLDELKALAAKKSKTARFAKLALKFAQSLEVLPTAEGDADSAFLKLDKNSIVATNDAALRKKLSKKSIRTIYLRAKKHLALS
jgi:rRNA-processing protein FCF1